MTELVEFLLARIAEDEADVRGHLAFHQESENHRKPGPDYDCPECMNPDAMLPSRVLAECEAKRRIVSQHYDQEAEFNASIAPEDRIAPRCACCNDGQVYYEDGRWPCTTLRALALPYVTHPDYDKEWSLAPLKVP